MEEESTGPLFRGRKSSRGEALEDLTHSLVIHEEECMVLPDGATEGPAELVADESGLYAAARRKGPNCIQVRVADVVPCAAVKLVRPPTNGGVNHATRGATIFSAVIVRFQT